MYKSMPCFFFSKTFSWFVVSTFLFCLFRLCVSLGLSFSFNVMCSPSIGSLESTKQSTKHSTIRKQQPYDQVIQVLSFVLLIVALFISTSDEGVALTEARTDSSSASKRGKFIGSSFDAKDLYDAYKEIESNYYSVAFAEESKSLWRTLVEKDGVEVAMMEHESEPNCPYVRLSVTIPAPLEDCWQFLSLDNWDESMPKMDPFYEGVELHGEFVYKKVHMILARKRTSRILTFGKRDFVFLSVTDEPLEDGTWVSGTVSVETPKIPRQKSYVRAFQDSIAFYKAISANKTNITIVCRIDLNDSAPEDGSGGGWIPMYVYVKTVGISGARSVLNMRKVLIEAQKEKLLADDPTIQAFTPRKKRNFLPPWSKKPKSKKMDPEPDIS